MNKVDGVSVIIPAYNEEGNIANAVQSAVKAVSSIVPLYEIIIVDDASTDETESVSRALVKKRRFVRYIRRSTNGGLGKTFLTGMQAASMEYITWFPGDNDTSRTSLKDLVGARHDADLIVTYTVNPWTRSYLRRFISWGFTTFLNSLYGFGLRYYNGCFIAKTDLVRSIDLFSAGHAIFAELKIKLLSRGVAYKQIPFYHAGRKTGSTTLFRWKNILSTLETIWLLFREMKLKREI